MVFRQLIIISAARSGTNYLCSTMSRLEGCLSFYEMFNASAVFKLDNHPAVAAELRENYGFSFESESDPDFVAQVAANPFRFFSAMCEIAQAQGASFLSFKLFPTCTAGIENTLKMIDQKNSRVLFVVRKRVDSLISLKKAQLLDTFVHRDTTRMLPQLNVGEFLEKARRNDNWYDVMFNRVKERAIPYAILNYDKDINVPLPKLCDTLADAAIKMGISTSRTFSEGDGIVALKQDRQSDWRHKIANARAVEQELNDRNLMEYALGTPLEGES